ncbi:hypothetical protein FB45DRAFT_357147 [Roridomyces roridus]|uniref:SMODS and SLOG-associating 2TM effector domain-containing protein n=1 Tax=Roridomyces roridus TaxID=1738132 RepID=A0AAD7C7V1_9AGAR|nr:hypothetical protein FB45DRAFT_357147 [Roridomyces roridus]
MASDEHHTVPVASTSRIQIVTAPRGSLKAESTRSDTSAIAGILGPARAATGSPGPVPRVESPLPLSSRSDALPPLPDDDEQDRHRLIPEHAGTQDSRGNGQTIEIAQPRPLPRSASMYQGHRENSQHRTRSELDWIIPVEAKRERQRTIRERLQPTLDTATVERENCAFKAKITGYALNAAIGMQVVLGSLTTGLSAATSGRTTSITVSVLGALSTIVASYLARARGSNEPELSITRTKDLDQFIRECETFMMDFGHITGNEHDDRLNGLRRRFEELLGNANGCVFLCPVCYP